MTEVKRRDFLKYTAGAAVGLAVGGAAGYTLAPTPTVPTTAPTTLPPRAPALTVADRAVDGARALVDSGIVPRGAVLRLLHAAGSRPQLAPFLNEWEQRTGIKVELATVGVEGDIFTKLVSEATTKTGEFDMATVFSTWMGDLVESGIAKPLDEFYTKYDPIGSSEVAPIEPLGSYTTKYKDKRYALFADADVFTLTYRKDLFENPNYQSEFQSTFGYPLKPPDTWEQTIDIAKFFNDKNLKAPDGDKIYGAFFYIEPVFAGYTTWWTIFTAKGGMLFSPKDMKPLINSPEGVESLELLVKLVPYMHPETVTGSWPNMYQRYPEGKAAMAMAWPSLLKFAQDPTTSKVAGLNGSALAPGAEVTVGGTKKIVKAAVNPVNWVGMVSNFSKNPEAAYLFLQWWTSPEVGFNVVPLVGIMDVFRENWFAEDRYKSIMNLAYTPQFISIFKDAIAHSFPDLTIPGAFEYLDKLNKAIHAVGAGIKQPKQALDEVATDWEDVTDSKGREKQLAGWSSVVQLYPDDVKQVWKEKGYI